MTTTSEAPSIEVLRARLVLLRRDRVAALKPLKNAKAELVELARAHAPDSERMPVRARRDVHAQAVRQLSREVELIARQLAGLTEGER